MYLYLIAQYVYFGIFEIHGGYILWRIKNVQLGDNVLNIVDRFYSLLHLFNKSSILYTRCLHVNQFYKHSIGF